MPEEPKEAASAQRLHCDANRRSVLLSGVSLLALSAMSKSSAQAQSAPTAVTAPPIAGGGKANILFFWGDDIGIANISTYSNGADGL